MIVHVKLAGGTLPARGSAGASGYDLSAIGSETIQPGASVLIETGVHVELPPGLEAQVRPRSSLSRAGIIVPLGTIDSDYRGSIGVVLINASRAAFRIKHGDRIAQLVFARVEHPTFEVVDELDETARGTGGFGSTGR